MKPIFLFFTAFLLLSAMSCSKSSSPNSTSATLPNVQTGSVTNITDTTATFRGDIMADGGSTVATCGFCWVAVDTTTTVNPAPTPNDNNVVLNGTTGGYTVTVNGLAPDTKYNVRAYAINKAGISYGQVISFKTSGSIVSTMFTIPGGKITDLDTDLSGNVYVTGTFQGSTTKLDCFVAKFNTDGTLAWRKDIVTNDYDIPQGGIVVINGLVYVYVCDDIMGLGSGSIYINAYNCQSGDLKFTTKIGTSNEDEALGLMSIDENGYIYAFSYCLISVLDSNGKIVKLYNYPANIGFDCATFMNGSMYSGGSSYNGGNYAFALVRKFDENFNTVWDQIEADISTQSNVQSIISFAKDSLIIVGESSGELQALSTTPVVPAKTSVICYKLRRDGSGMDSIWGRKFSDQLEDISLKRYDDKSFYVFSSNYNNVADGPIEMDLAGNILWTASPKKNGNIAVFNGKLFLADGTDNLKIYNQ